MTYEEFVDDKRTYDAALHNLVVIGEAANYVPHEIQSRFSSVPWRDMIGMRNIIVHAYFRVSEPDIWRVVTQRVPPLTSQLESLLGSADTP